MTRTGPINEKLCLVGNDVFADVEMFVPYTHEHEAHTVLKTLEKYAPNRACMKHIEHVLSTPLYCSDRLKERQRKLRTIENVYVQDESDTLPYIRSHEDVIEWVLTTSSSELELPDSLESVYFTWRCFQRCGCNDSALLIWLKNAHAIVLAPLMSALSPLISVVVPYIILRYRFGFKISLITFVRSVVRILVFQITHMWNARTINTMHALTCIVSFVVYLQSVLTTVELSKNTYKVLALLNRKMSGALSYISACDKLLISYGVETKTCPAWARRSLGVGEKLVLFQRLRALGTPARNQLELFLAHANEHMAYLTISRMRRSLNMCFAEYEVLPDTSESVPRTSTSVCAEGMFHICLQSPVPNTLRLKNSNCVITGPNAAGKSTAIKALVINVLFAQSFGVACATRFSLAPFYYMHTQINIPDVKGKQSLFEAEMHRCKSIIDITSCVPHDRRCLIVMDEMFNTTNVVEGVAGAQAILNRLNSFENCCTVITTHYIMLARSSRFKTYRMEATLDSSETRPRFTYTLKRGVSRQFIAIELLREHFDHEIIEDAINTKNKLLLV